MANKEIRQFNSLSAATGSELLLFMLSGVTKNMTLDVAKDYIFGGYGGNLSYLGFNIIPNEISQDITLPENSTIYYYGDLNIASGYTLNIPTGTTLTLIDPTLDVTVTGGTFSNGVATFTDNIGATFEVSGFTSLADVGFNVIPNEINQDITLPENSTVYYYGDLNIASGYTLTIPSGSTLEFISEDDVFITGDTINNSVLLGGDGNEIDISSNNSVIVGGSGNAISLLSDNSVVIGGVGITGTTANTVYVPKLNINDLPIGDALNNLAIDTNGNIVVSDLYSLSDLGFNITSRPSKVIYQNIILPEDTDVTYASPLTMDVNNIIIVPVNTILTII